MAIVELVPITAVNWKSCVNLELLEAQRGLLPSNLYSIAEAQFYPRSQSRAILHQGAIVGYALFGIDEATGLWKVFRLMIDARNQGKGFGLATMQTILDEIASKPDSTDVLIAYQESNLIAAKPYEKLGFVVTERRDGHAHARLFKTEP